MMNVLVTGGTGVLGRRVVARLVADGAKVRVLSRRATTELDGADMIRGDLITGDGLEPAVAGVDAIVHCASNPNPRRNEVDIDGTRRLLDAAGSAGTGPHLVYISIVGVDRVPYSYYRAKLQVEKLVAESGLPWTILRTTQFHDLVLQVIATLARLPVVPVFRLPDQPIDTDEVAERLAVLALGAPAGRVPDMGGPRVERLDRLMRLYLKEVGRRRPVVPISFPGKLYAAFRDGGHLAPEHAVGRTTFAEFMRSRVRNGRVDLSYHLRRSGRK